MNRFQNEIVMGGSDVDSESEYEYMSGQDMVNLKYAQQCMYNATMYNVMMQNMMPCFPMPCIPAYGYPMPYPSMTPNRPVNHATAAGHYYEKGGRSRQSRKSRSKGDGNAYRTPHHRQHRVVSRHRYYEPSSESEDDCIYTGEKGVQACRSVNRKMSADKSDDTLRHLNPGSSNTCNGVEPQRVQNNMPNVDCKLSSPLQSDIKRNSVQASVDIAELPLNQVRHANNNSQLNSRTDSTERASHVIPADESQIAAVLQNLPSNDPDKQNAMVAMIECQQEKQTAEVNVAEDQSHSGVSGHKLGMVSSNRKSTLNSAVLQLVLRQVWDQPTEATVTSKSDQQIELPPLTTAETAMTMNGEMEANTATNSLPSSKPTLLGDNRAECEASSIKTTDPTEGTLDPKTDSHHIVDQDLLPVQGADDRGYRGPDIVHPKNPAQDPLWSKTTYSLKCLQSFHSLRKVWAEWETKYRPPPVSVYKGQGAGPQNLHASIS